MRTNRKSNVAEFSSDEDDSACSDSISGLCLIGTIAFRTKRQVPGNSNVEIVTYTIVDNDEHHYYVDDYSPSEYFNIGQPVKIPVYVKAYKKKLGDASYSLNRLKSFQPITKGEAF